MQSTNKEDTILPKIALGAWAWGNDGTFGGSPIGRSGAALIGFQVTGNALY